MRRAIEIYRVGEDAFEERLRAIAERATAGDTGVESAVREIIAEVRTGGDRALVDATRRFDRVDVSGRLEISRQELAAAEAALSPAPGARCGLPRGGSGIFIGARSRRAGGIETRRGWCSGRRSSRSTASACTFRVEGPRTPRRC